MVIEFMKAVLFGIVEGITEWLPVSSTGHMILLEEFVQLNASPAFKEMFLVVIQLGAILAVVMLYWKTIFPFNLSGEGAVIKKETIILWLKIIVACIPAALIGIPFDDQIDALFYNYQTVSIALITFGIIYIIVENRNQSKKPITESLSGITYRMAFLIGLFQLIAAIFPGTSRSGATIVGGLIIGMSRGIAAEFTFLLAIPVMFGASLLKLLKFGFQFTQTEVMVLLTGMIVAFGVSVAVIKLLMGYIRKHDFKVFGWYRIALGIVVLGYFLIAH